MDDDRPEQIELIETEGLAAGVVFDASGRVDCDRPCVRCAYNLRGLDPAGVCPECALPIEHSLSSNRLKYADQKWLRTVQDGLLLMTVSFAAVVAVIYLRFVGGFINSALSSIPEGGRFADIAEVALAGLAWITCAVGAVMGLAGVVLATAPEPPETATPSDDLARRWTRRLTCACVAVLAAALALEQVPSFRTAVGPSVPVVAVILALTGAAYSNCVFLRNLLRRGDVGGEDLARVAIPGTLVAGALLLIQSLAFDLIRGDLGSLFLLGCAGVFVAGLLLPAFILALLVKARRAVRRALSVKLDQTRLKSQGDPST